MSKERVTATLVANAGVLVEYNGVRLLVDGLHHEEGHPFSKVPEETLGRMMDGVDPYASIDYVFFTHEHPDHFTPACAADYLKRQPVKGLFLPAQVSDDSARLYDDAQGRSIFCKRFGLAPGEMERCVLADGVEAAGLGALHMGPQFRNVRNDCILLTLGGSNLLFTGDADHVPEFYEEALSDVVLDAVFVNPLFFHHPKGRAVINEIFRPRYLAIYHVPFEQDDDLQFGKLVARDIERHGRPDVQTRVLQAEGQTLEIAPRPR
jgi:L-ascorbate metabolism protein UlaG (beta-lactamase superfamily)